jgi:hypothetical protein
MVVVVVGDAGTVEGVGEVPEGEFEVRIARRPARTATAAMKM